MSDPFSCCLGWTGSPKRTMTAQFGSTKKRRAGDTPDDDYPDEYRSLFDDDDDENTSSISTNQLRALLRREVGVLSRRCDALEAENAELRRQRRVDRLRADSLGRSVRVLGKDVAWTYSAPDIPRRHWDIRGHDAAYIDAAQRFVRQIGAAAIRLRLGEADSVRIASATTVEHDAAYLPHWSELADAVQVSGGVRAFEVEGAELTPEVLSILGPPLTGSGGLELFGMHRNLYGDISAGVEFVRNVIDGNDGLRDVIHANCSLVSTENAVVVAEAAARSRSVDFVGLGGACGADVDGYRVLCALLDDSSGLTRLSMYNNSIRTNGDTSLPDYLAANPGMVHLDLSGNNFNDEDALLIAAALRTNDTLKYLDLDGNDLTVVGLNALECAICDETDLNALSDSNHSCRIVGVTESFEVWHEDEDVNRGFKIYKLLSKRHAEGQNSRHFERELPSTEFDMRLVPFILAAIGHYSQCSREIDICCFGDGDSIDVASPLSIMLELTKGWKLPEIIDQSSRLMSQLK